MSGRKSTQKSLWGEIKGRLKVTSVKKLQSHGVDRVRVIGMDQITSLVEKVVDRVLDERMVEMEEVERERVVADVKDELKRLNKEVKQLNTDREKAREEAAELDSLVNDLRLEIHREQQRIEEARKEGSAPQALALGPDAATLEAMRQLLEDGLDAPDNGIEALLTKITELVWGSEREEAVSGAGGGEHVRLLEKRLNKLKNQLTAAETNLVKALEGKEIDAGIASIYRDVQGLANGERDFKKKRELMSVIFTANKNLQADLVSTGGQS